MSNNLIKIHVIYPPICIYFRCLNVLTNFYRKVNQK